MRFNIKKEYGWVKEQSKRIHHIENKKYKLLSENKHAKKWLDKKFEKISNDERKLRLFNHVNKYGKIKQYENAGDDKMTIIWFNGQKRFINSKTDKLYLFFSENDIIKGIFRSIYRK